MHNELNVKIGEKDHKAFLQNGFYNASVQTTTMHKHNYAEVHIVDGSDAVFHIGDTVHRSTEGNLLIIPRNVYHCINNGTNAHHVAFQIDYDIRQLYSRTVEPQTVRDFFKEIEICKDTDNYSTVSAYVSLFCSMLCLEKSNVRQISDYSFLIYEFFSKHYHEDVRLSDLASVLHLSERQTERLVIKSTGNTFLGELTEVRMNVAEHLLKTTDMTLEEISNYIGYRSYAGFWKAKKKNMR